MVDELEDGVNMKRADDNTLRKNILLIKTERSAKFDCLSRRKYYKKICVHDLNFKVQPTNCLFNPLLPEFFLS